MNLSDPDGGKPKPEGLMNISNVGLQEFTENPFGAGQLTIDGQQFSSPSTSGTAESVFATVVVATANPPHFAGHLYELEFGLTSAIRSESTAPSTVSWQWQGRGLNEGQAFRNLHAEDSTATEGTAFVENTFSGRFDLDKDLDRFPLEIQLLIKSGTISDGVAKAKNSTFVRSVTSSLYRRALD